MANKGMEFVTEDGEIRDDIFIRLNEKYFSKSSDLRIAADPKELIATKKDFRIYPVKEEETREVSREFGELKDLHSNRRFSKVFQYEDPEFTKDSYYKYWFKLCLRADQDTNIIFKRHPLHRVTINKEIIDICEGSRNVIYRFLKECRQKNLISRFTHKNQKLFVLNPKYVLNGHEIPLSIYNLFNKKLEDFRDREESARDGEEE